MNWRTRTGGGGGGIFQSARKKKTSDTGLGWGLEHFYSESSVEMQEEACGLTSSPSSSCVCCAVLGEGEGKGGWRRLLTVRCKGSTMEQGGDEKKPLTDTEDRARRKGSGGSSNIWFMIRILKTTTKKSYPEKS